MGRFERMIVGTLAGAARNLLAALVVFALVVPAPKLAAGLIGGNAVATSVTNRSLASTRRLSITGATPAEEQRIRYVIGAIRYPLNTSLFTVDVYDRADSSDMAGAAAYYEFPASVIHIKRDAIDGQSDSELGHVVAHEIGHMVDMLYLTEADRTRIRDLRGYPTSITWDDRSVAWDRRPSEDFAEVFAQLTQPLSMTPVGTSYGEVDHEAQLRSVLAARVTNGTETLHSIRAERLLNEVSSQLTFVSSQTWSGVALETMVILYAISGAVAGLRRSRLEWVREQAYSHRCRSTTRAVRHAPGAAFADRD